MIDSLGEHLVHILHTKDGAQVALQCVWHGTAKVTSIMFFKKNFAGFKINFFLC